MRFRWTLVVVVLCCGCGSGPSTAPSPAPTPAPNPAPVSQVQLAGTVVDALSRSGIAATVDLLTPSGVLLAETAADASGRFTFGLVAVGNYILRASAPGYDRSSQTINVSSNLNVGLGLSRATITALMIADPGNGTNMFCKANGTTASNVSLVNGSSYSVDVTFNGGDNGDPATQGVTYRFTLPPANTRVFLVTAGSYGSTGQSADGQAVLEKAGWVFSRGCDFSLAICVLSSDRACHLGAGAAARVQSAAIR